MFLTRSKEKETEKNLVARVMIPLIDWYADENETNRLVRGCLRFA